MLVAIAGNASVPTIAPARPTATEIPTPAPRRWVGNSSVNIAYADVHAAVPNALATANATGTQAPLPVAVASASRPTPAAEARQQNPTGTRCPGPSKRPPSATPPAN